MKECPFCGEYEGTLADHVKTAAHKAITPSPSDAATSAEITARYEAMRLRLPRSEDCIRSGRKPTLDDYDR